MKLGLAKGNPSPVKTYATMRTAEKKGFWRDNPIVGEISIDLAFLSAPFKMYCENDDTVVKELYWSAFQGWELGSLTYWKAFASQAEGKVILDIGSYTGIYSLLASQAAANASIFAFDIQEECLKRLKKNIAINGSENIECHLSACSDRDGTIDFFFYEEPEIISSVASTVPKAVNDKQSTVAAIRVDTLLASRGLIGSVALVKIDAEDAELQTLSGMKEMIALSKPDLLIEINDTEHIAPVQASLPENYALYRIDEANVSLMHVSTENPSARKFRNYLATARTQEDLDRLFAS